MVCFTAAFDIAPEFLAVFQKQNDVLRYIVKDDPLKKTEDLGTDGDVIFAAGCYLAEDNALTNALKESGNPKRPGNYLKAQTDQWLPAHLVA